MLELKDSENVADEVVGKLLVNGAGEGEDVDEAWVVDDAVGMVAGEDTDVVGRETKSDRVTGCYERGSDVITNVVVVVDEVKFANVVVVVVVVDEVKVAHVVAARWRT